METKDNVISLFEYRLNRQRIKDDELEWKRYIEQCKFDHQFEQQHSDDDLFINNREFEFSDSDD